MVNLSKGFTLTSLDSLWKRKKNVLQRNVRNPALRAAQTDEKPSSKSCVSCNQPVPKNDQPVQFIIDAQSSGVLDTPARMCLCVRVHS